MKKKYLICLIVLFSIGNAVAQNIDSALARFNKVNPFEKAYVQFDNGRYTAGQTIWYKAYLLTGVQPSLISKNFYIDWYDDAGRFISSTITPIVYSYSTGSFALPKNYTGRFIHAIAYTKWMRNFDSSYFFRKDLQIVSSVQEPLFVAPAISETFTQFLPESGTLLANKMNLIAFKAVNNLGLPEKIQGAIINSKGDTITYFKSVHDGMGKFQLNPEANEKYFAVWTDARGKNYKTNMAETEEIGVNLIVEPGSANRLFHIQRTTNAPEQLKHLTLVGQMYGAILFKASLNLAEKESITSNLPINKLVTGILQLTVFDENMKPLCERIIFIKNADYILHATVRFDTLNTLRRGKNIIEIALQDSSFTNLSIAVTDAKANMTADNTILSQLLLNADLSGNIYKPAYYFSSDEESVTNNMDLLMLTNGWRRYNWKNILKNQLHNFLFTRDSAYQSISGKIADYNLKKSYKTDSINLVFSVGDSGNYMLNLPIMEDGSFSQKDIILCDSFKIYYKINGKAGGTKKVLTVSNDFFQPNRNITLQHLNYYQDTTGHHNFKNLIDSQYIRDLLNQKNTLKGVTVFARERAKMKVLEDKYTFGVFNVEPAVAAFDLGTLENASHTTSVFDFLTGKVPGLSFSSTIAGTIMPTAQFYGSVPAFYLNESYIETEDVSNIDMNNVAYIKVFNPPFFGGYRGEGGGIAIYTKKGPNNYSDEAALKYYGKQDKIISGYTPYKEFYMPSYPEIRQSQEMTDFRTTLLWNPWINLNKKNRTTRITFYNNDMSNSFRLILEGMDGKGKLVHIERVVQ